MARRFLIALVVATTSGVMLAQSGAADPMSGTWTGLIGPGASPNYQITMQLKFDPQRGFSGTAQGAAGETAVLKTGSFDAQTGALRLEFELKNDSATATATFDGIAVLDTMSGRLTLSNQPGPGTFMLKRSGISAASPATSSTTGDTNALLAKSFGDVSGWITKAADLVPADKYTYQPAKTVRTFGQLIGHIADGYDYYCGRAQGKNVQWSDATEKGRTDKATIVPKLKQALANCTAVHGTGQTAPLIENLGHANLHYGNIVTYMRLLGLTPPSS